MNYIKSQDTNQAITDISSKIILSLKSGKKVLWLICGGSNIPVAIKAMDLIHTQTDGDKISNLTVGQTDERYGPVGHKDSNWAQLTEYGLNLHGVKQLPILANKSLEVTVSQYSDELKTCMDETLSSGGLIIALFGIGSDSHIAGILPNSPVFTDPRLVSGYEAGHFIRVTMTPHAIRKVSVSFALAFGEGKRDAVLKLRDSIADPVGQPAQILKELSGSFVYSDQF